jgi:hypothetical protein
VLLIALTAGAGPVRAQSVPPGWSLPADSGYVSVSGAVAFGFPAALRKPSADPIGMVPPESRIPGLCHRLFEDMWRGSAAFRRQWTRLANARVPVTIVLTPMIMSTKRAHAELSRTPSLRARIFLPLVNLEAVEYLAHEIEHVLEALDEVDLPLAVKQRLHGAVANGRPPLYETDRATAMGRLVAREVSASAARR